MQYTFETVEKKIQAIVVRTLKVELSGLNSDARLIEELGADSLDALTIAMDIDREFGIRVNDGELGSFRTCREITRAVLRHLGQQTPAPDPLSM